MMALENITNYHNHLMDMMDCDLLEDFGDIR